MSDTILASTIASAKHKHRFPGFYATTDLGGIYRVVAEVEGQIIVEGSDGKALGRLIKTGRTVHRDGLVRVQIQFASDLGDTAGTLSFTDPGGVVDGHANYRLFEAPGA